MPIYPGGQILQQLLALKIFLHLHRTFTAFSFRQKANEDPQGV